MAIARGAVALLLVVLETYQAPTRPSIQGVTYLFYFLYSFAAWIWEKRDEGERDLHRLILDLIVLPACIVSPPDRFGWGLSLFLFLVLARTMLLHGLRELLLVAGTVAIFSLLLAQDHGVLFAPLLLVAGGIALLAGWQREVMDRRIAKAGRMSVVYRTEAENARELERQRIAADFHDGPLQSFISFQMRLEVIKKLLTRDTKMATDDLEQLQDICRKQITDMRTFVRSMRSWADGSSPATSMRQIAEDFQKSSGMSLTWNVSDTLSGLDPEISHEVLQIAREALHNAQKHSKAAKLSLATEKTETALMLTIEDDGSGFPFGGTYNLEELELMRMGPESIKRRVRTLGGELIIESNPGRGSALRIRVPL